jgi:hypothetical protein
VATLTLRGVVRRKAPPTASKPPPKAPISPAPRPTGVPVEVFYFIWCPTTNRPRKRHPTLAAAEVEAKRLRELGTDKEFLVYEARLLTAEATSTNKGEPNDAEST